MAILALISKNRTIQKTHKGTSYVPPFIGTGDDESTKERPLCLAGLQTNLRNYLGGSGSGRDFKKIEEKERTHPGINQGGFDFIYRFNENETEKP